MSSGYRFNPNKCRKRKKAEPKPKRNKRDTSESSTDQSLQSPIVMNTSGASSPKIFSPFAPSTLQFPLAVRTTCDEEADLCMPLAPSTLGLPPTSVYGQKGRSASLAAKLDEIFSDAKISPFAATSAIVSAPGPSTPSDTWSQSTSQWAYNIAPELQGLQAPFIDTQEYYGAEANYADFPPSRASSDTSGYSFETPSFPAMPYTAPALQSAFQFPTYSPQTGMLVHEAQQAMPERDLSQMTSAPLRMPEIYGTGATERTTEQQPAQWWPFRNCIGE